MSLAARFPTRFAWNSTKTQVDWEEVNCLLCQSDHWKIVLQAPDVTQAGGNLWFPLAQCQECGFCFTNPRPTEETLPSFYPAEYSPHFSRGNLHRSGWRKRYPLHPSLLRKLLPNRNDSAPAKLLDFGCGNGFFLTQMRNIGWNVQGVDFCSDLVSRLRDQLELIVHLGTLPHDDLQGQMFDLITMWHSLEHVPDPILVLDQAHRLLNRDGYLVIAVPNLASWQFRTFGAAWSGLDLPRHLSHFTPHTLKEMLARCGMTIRSSSMIRHSSWVRNSAKVARMFFQPSIFQCVLAGKLPSRLFSFFSNMCSQSDCIVVVAQKT